MTKHNIYAPNDLVGLDNLPKHRRRKIEGVLRMFVLGPGGKEVECWLMEEREVVWGSRSEDDGRRTVIGVKWVPTQTVQTFAGDMSKRLPIVVVVEETYEGAIVTELRSYGYTATVKRKKE